MENKQCSLCLDNQSICLTFSCNHTICKQCTYKLILYNQTEIFSNTVLDTSISLKCIKCKKGTANQTITEIYKSLNSMSLKINNKLCHNGKTQNFNCTKCNKKFCEICIKEHKAQKPKHLIVKIDSDSLKICIKHENKSFYKCLACDVCFCKQCESKTHSDHNYLNLSIFRQEMLEKCKNEFEWKNADEINKAIEDKFDKVHQSVSETKNKILKELFELRNKVEGFISECKHKFDSYFENIELTKLALKESYLRYLSDLNDPETFNYVEMKPATCFYFEEHVEFSNEMLQEINKLKDYMATSLETIGNKELSLGIRYSKQEYNLLTSLKSDGLPIYCLLELDSGTILSGTYQRINIYPNYHTIIHIEAHDCYVSSMIELKDGTIASASWDKTIKLWDKEFKCISVLEGHSNKVTTLLQQRDGRIASGSWDMDIRLWNGKKCEYTFQGHVGYVASLALLRTEHLFASSSWDNTIKIWDTKNYICIDTITIPNLFIYSIIETYNDKLVACCSDHRIRIFDNNKCVNVLEGHSGYVKSICQLRDGRLVSGAWDKSIRIWGSGDYGCRQVINGHDDYVNVVIQLRNGNLASGSDDNAINIWC
jgi:hypothetical protein